MNADVELAVDWEYARFDQLSVEKLLAILQERQKVFVLEQQCLYPDIDGFDKQAIHLIGWLKHADQEHRIAAYLRVMAPGVSYAEASIGRVLVSEAARGLGLGEELMRRCLKRVVSDYPDSDVRISAQHYLENFYVNLGFVTTSEVYDEDGIPHIDMLLAMHKAQS